VQLGKVGKAKLRIAPSGQRLSIPQAVRKLTNFRLEVRIHSRSAGKGSIVKAAAYRAAERLSERSTSVVSGAAERSGSALEHGSEVFDFTAKRGVVAAEIHGPDHMPERFTDRGTLWREVEASERRKDARLAREAIISIPRELTREQGIDAVRGWVSEQCVERGMIADVSWHEVRARDGGRNLHAHVLCTTREVTADGFGRKAREWDRKELVHEWRESWQDHANWQLEQAGVLERVDHRSLAAQRDEALTRGDLATLAKVDREPTVYLPRMDFERERRGEITPEVERKREVAARNAARSALYTRLAELGGQSRELFMELRQKTGDAMKAIERSPWLNLMLGRERQAEPVRDRERELER
jgi:hypothetical protein